MPKQLLIYERAVPVSPQRHKDLSIKAGNSFAYARSVNSVPLMAAEFPNAAAEHAVVFSGQGDDVVPVVLLGVRDDENLFVGPKGEWLGHYVPAFLRRVDEFPAAHQSGYSSHAAEPLDSRAMQRAQ